VSMYVCVCVCVCVQNHIFKILIIPNLNEFFHSRLILHIASQTDCTCRLKALDIFWSNSFITWTWGWREHFHNTDHSIWHVAGTDHLLNERARRWSGIAEGHWTRAGTSSCIFLTVIFTNVNFL
jgi:hypothetical protein